MENNRRDMGTVKFILFYSELTPTDPWCNMLHTLLGQKNYVEAMPDEQIPVVVAIKNRELSVKFFRIPLGTDEENLELHQKWVNTIRQESLSERQIDNAKKT